MAWCKGAAFRKLGAELIAGKAEIEWRAMGDGAARGHDHIISPGRAPAILDLFRQAGRIQGR